MIDFYSWKTPNGQKVAIMLEETGLPYQVHWVDISNQAQFKPDYLAINPNNKIPTIVDQDGPGHQPFSLFESGAILMYLAEKTGKLLPTEPQQRAKTIQWLMFQMGGVGPMLGQLHHFARFAPEKIPYAIERYAKEANRLYRVMDQQFEKTGFFVDTYSIADIATFPWVHLYEFQGIDISRYPHVKAWHDKIAARPAVVSGLSLVPPG